MRAQQQYYNQQNHGNPYGKPYGNPYGNPYARPNSTYVNSYGENRSGAKPDDPFGEFTSENKGDGNSDPFADVGGHSDDLFN